MVNKINMVLVPTILVTVLFFSCNQQNLDKAENIETANKNIVIDKENKLNIDSVVSTINKLREEIETNLGESNSINTSMLRAKIKQKWSKIDYYLNDSKNVIRIKTYPHSETSLRTEEFYLADERLALAIIEDDGSGERGKNDNTVDKLYYFYQDRLVKETKHSNSSEYTIRDGDAEELLSEVKEYLDIFEKKIK